MVDDAATPNRASNASSNCWRRPSACSREKGYGATRISDICAAAGVAKGLFYWYFPTKESLFGELVRTMRLSLRRAQAAAMDPDADPVTRIRQGAEASVRFMAEHQPYFALLDVERTDDALAASVMKEGSDVYSTDVLRLIEAAQRDGLLRRRRSGVLRGRVCWVPCRRSAMRTAWVASPCRSTSSPTSWATGSCKH